MAVIERSFEEHLQTLKSHLDNDKPTRFRSEFLSLHDYEKAKNILNEIQEKED